MKEFFEFGKEPIFEYEPSLEKIQATLPPVDRSLEYLAKRVLQSRPLNANKGASSLISPEHLALRIRKYIEIELGLCSNNFRIEFTHSDQTIMSVGRERNEIFVRIANRPIPEHLVPSLLVHEIGTHFVRMYNDGWRRRQTWSSFKTEEGLAVLCAMFSDNDTSIRSISLRYVACIFGSELGFKDLFDRLGEYIADSEARFRYCCRVKRGIADTSRPGAYGMDQAYLIGVIELLAKRHQIDWFYLFSGLVGLDGALAPQYSTNRNWVLPPSLRYECQLINFRKFLDDVVEKNGITNRGMRRSKSYSNFTLKLRYSLVGLFLK